MNKIKKKKIIYIFYLIINEVITTDDIFLKHLEINKGIESIWVPNNLMLGFKIK